MDSFPKFDESEPSLWPKNITLEEARESVAGRVDFRETVAYDYVSFIYFLGMDPDLFPDPNTASDDHTKRMRQIRRECRGIIFHKDGHILSRRFQKFFNIGELPETNIDNITITQPFVLLEKLDGSMIAPFFVEGTLRYCTKSGYTDSSKIVEEFVAKHSDDIPYNKFCIEAIECGFSPIFEWCSPAGRIVLEYKEESLHLLALRHNITGNYVPFDQVISLASSRGIPYVKKWQMKDFDEEESKRDLSGDALKSLHRHIQSQVGVEGFVLQQSNGVMYKIKTSWYFTFHRSTQFLKYYGERHVWESILNGTFDDIKAWLPGPVRDAINRFASELMSRAEAISKTLLATASEGFQSNPERSAYNAQIIVPCKEPSQKPILWKIYAELVEGKNPVTPQLVYEWVLENLRTNTSSSKTLKKNSGLVGNLSYEAYRPKNEVTHVFAETADE
jgi:RNA ligase